MIEPAPIADLPREEAAGIRFVLFDIDDTITEAGLLPEASYSALWALKRAGVAAVPVTGRPAGWCDLIARQWPVAGVVGENGAFAFFMKEGHLQRLFHPAAPAPESSRERLAVLGNEAMRRVPGVRLAKDQPYRLFDIALDFAEEPPALGLDEALEVKKIFEAGGARAKVSSIHVNAWFGDYDKLSMSELFLSSILGWNPMLFPRAAIFFGDSPNDEPMFERFELSCGVANVRRFYDVMKHPPAYVTDEPYGRGFAEGIRSILASKALDTGR
jgi:3-deoxy-D-manno-octulosonate 8-phosphate phosphatase KdsC-like HAD superfamily phosphatase